VLAQRTVVQVELEEIVGLLNNNNTSLRKSSAPKIREAILTKRPLSARWPKPENQVAPRPRRPKFR
jgi:hypothetical protein